MKDNTILIGFMGAGKTSIGTCWSKRENRPLLDIDQLIEAEAGMSIPMIFSEHGEDAFRRIESRVLERLNEEADHVVISVGGGLPLRAENRAVLAELGTVVFLRTQPDTVLSRLDGDVTRPLLQVADRRAKVEQLLRERNPIYEQAAHLVIDVDGKSPDQIVQELETALRQTNRRKDCETE
ncbi:MAG: shikimate kinase [Lachnospiraceae bacterium]